MLTKNRSIYGRKLFKKSKRFEEYNSVTEALKVEKGITDAFVLMLNTLTLEEVFAVKQEAMAKAFNGIYFHVPIYTALPKLIQDAILMSMFIENYNVRDIAAALGLNKKSLRILLAARKIFERSREKHALLFPEEADDGWVLEDKANFTSPRAASKKREEGK
jgi:hypothetical protein